MESLWKRFVKCLKTIFNFAIVKFDRNYIKSYKNQYLIPNELVKKEFTHIQQTSLGV